MLKTYLESYLYNYKSASKYIENAYQLVPNDAFILKVRWLIEKIDEDFLEALANLNRVFNGNFILKVRGHVKAMLNDDLEVLVDLDQALKLKPKDAFT